MSIRNANVTTVASQIYTSTGNSAVLTIHLCNYSGSAVTANVFVVPNGSTANLLNIIYANTTITSQNTLITSTEKFILGNGDSVYANVSANVSVAATISYVGI